MRTTGLLVLLLASCSLESDYSEAFLWPSSVEVVVPTELGLDYEDVTLETGSETTVNGWFIPSADADGRTVLFSHGNGVNITFSHPYYTFLHDAGFNVFVYDYQGYGKSYGRLSMNALLSNMASVMDYLRSRPDVDPEKIALYGVSVGSLPTLRGASRFASIAGVVVEDVVSPEDFEVQRQREAGNSEAASQLGSYFLGYLAIPWALEPENSAASIDTSLLYLTGARRRDLPRQFRIYAQVKGPKDMWLIPEADHVPTSLLVQDREYQAGVAAFLERCFAGERMERISVEYRSRQRGSEWATQVTLTRQGTDDTSPWPVEIAFLQEGQITFHRVWSRQRQESFDVPLPGRPLRASAWRYRFAVDNPASESWQPDRTPLANAHRVHGDVLTYIERMRSSDASIDAALEAVDALEGLQEREPFSPVLEAELTELYWFIGQALTSSDDPSQREQGRVWLERCVAGVPDDPKMHYWPDSEELLGFPHGDAVARASLVLADLYGDEGRSTDAVRVLEAAARVAPEDRAVQEKLEEIRQGRD